MRIKSNSGFIEEFDKQRIINAITEDRDLAIKKGKISSLDEEGIKKIASSVSRKIKNMEFDEQNIVSSDTVRGLVTSELYRIGEKEVARISELIGIRFKDLYEIWGGEGFADNANVNSKTPEAQHTYIANYIAKKGAAHYIPTDVMNAHLNGRIHIHDLNYFTNRSFCSEWDLRYFLYYGMYADGTGDNIPISTPARDATVAILHCAKALGSAQQSFAGGQGAAHFLTFISPYLEGMSYKEIRQNMQMYIWEMSQMLSRGNQACFSTTQLTPGVPNIFKDVPVVYQGKIWDGIQAPLRKYGEFEREVRLAFKAYTEIMFNGDAFQRPFSFPKYEAEILSEHWISENWDVPLRVYHPDENEKEDMEEFKKWSDALEITELVPSYKELWMDMCKLIAKDGTPYLHNSLDANEGSITCYSCCAFNFTSDVKSDKDFDDKLHFRNGAHFILGSKQVGTLNLPQAAYVAKGSVDTFMKYCEESIQLLVKMFEAKEKCINNQSLPFARQTPIDPNDSTKRAPPLWDEKDLPYCIGIVGLNEAVQAMTGYQIHEDTSAHKMAVNLLVRLQIAVMKTSKESGIKIAFARSPAETTAQRFAICDLRSNEFKNATKFVVKGDLNYAIQNISKNDLPIYYTNGAMCATDADISVFEKIRLEEHAFSSFDGGNIFHFFLGESNPEPEGIFVILQKILSDTNIKYFAFTKDYSLCKNCNNNMGGLRDVCEKCGSDDVTQFSRITGYIQAISGKKISGWNQGKIQELKDRKRYVI